MELVEQANLQLNHHDLSLGVFEDRQLRAGRGTGIRRGHGGGFKKIEAPAAPRRRRQKSAKATAASA